MTPCPNCGASVEANARLCPNCGVDLLTVWPPPPMHDKSVGTVPVERLLTGRSWMDGLIGMGLCWLLAFVWERYALYAIDAFLRYNLRLGFSQPLLPEYLLDAAIAMPGLIVYPGVYFGMCALSSKMAREFGQTSLWLFGGLCVLLPVLWLLR